MQELKQIIDSNDPRKALEIIETIKFEERRREAEVQSFVNNLEKGLFDEQREVFREQAKQVTICCGRRSGKTTLHRRKLISSSFITGWTEQPPVSLYVAPTRNVARRLMWYGLQYVIEQAKIPFHFNNTDLIATNELTKCEIWMMGADTSRDIERARGFPFAHISIDEAQAIGYHLNYFIEEVLDAALSDYDGSIWLTGTPNASCVGYFHDACTGKEPGYEKFGWNITANKYFPRWKDNKDWKTEAQLLLDDRRKRKHWQLDNPTYRREWLGEWVRDTEMLVYAFSEKCLYDGELPDGHDWRMVCGVDLGFDDDFSIVVIAYSDYHQAAFEVFCDKWPGLIPSDWAVKLKDIEERFDVERIVIDTGGLGKAIAEEFRRRYRIQVEPAEKRNKLDYITLMNDDLITGKLKLIEDGKTASEMAILQWDESREKEDDRYANHCCDAMLYAWRYCYNYLWERKEEMPEKGTPEHNKMVEKKFWEDVEHEEVNKPFWMRGYEWTEEEEQQTLDFLKLLQQ